MKLWRKQKLILTAFLLFFVFMFFCTLVSRVVYAEKLPQVTTEISRRMAINHHVEAEGIVRQGREYAVHTISGLRVNTVYAHVGDRIGPETLLFEVDMEDLQEQIQEQELAIQKLKLQIQDLEQNRLQADQTRQTESNRAQEDYQQTDEETKKAIARAQEDLDDAEDALEAHQKNKVAVTPKKEREKKQAAYDTWVSEGERYSQALETATKAYESAKEETKRLEQESLASPSDQGLKDAWAAAKQAEQEAKTTFENAQATYQKHVENPVEKPDYSAEDAAKAAWDEKKDALKDAEQQAERNLLDMGQKRDEALLEAERKVGDANLPAVSDSSLEIGKLELTSLQTKLKRYQEVWEQEGKIYPSTQGIVTRIQVSSGERVSDGAAIVYADLSSPMQFQATLTKEQKKYVNQGDAVNLALGGTTSEDLKVDYVAENEANPEMYNVILFLPENLGTIGQSGTLKVNAQSETYSCCIPIQALHEDSNHRNYIYLLSSKSGILGEELAVEQVFVKVLDKNDSYAAIEEGVIDSETEMIVTSTEELVDRQVVRYRE